MKRKLVLKLAPAAGCILVLWVTIDLFGPRTADIRDFDPEEVSRLDTLMWRSYYDRKPLKLFFQLGELMRTQFHLPLLRSYVAAYEAARAAFIFKDGKNRSDYGKALPNLIRYFRSIRKISTIHFDVERASTLELEWWIVHRERAGRSTEDLSRALAQAAAELYQVPMDRMMEYARRRAEAMVIRDTKAEAGGLNDDDWAGIGSELLVSWQSLHSACRSRAGTEHAPTR